MRRGRFTPGGPTQPRAKVTPFSGVQNLVNTLGGPSQQNGPATKLVPQAARPMQAKVMNAAGAVDTLARRPGQALGNLGARMNLGGPTGRIAAMEEGYENALAYTQPGARGLLAALSGTFGGEVDPDTKQLVTLRQAGLGGRL